MEPTFGRLSGQPGSSPVVVPSAACVRFPEFLASEGQALLAGSRTSADRRLGARRLLGLLPCEDRHAVGWDDDRGRGGKAMQRSACCFNGTAIAGDQRIDPVVINIAIEDLGPLAWKRKTQRIIPPCGLGKCGNHDHIRTDIVDPPMVGQHAIVIGDIVWARSAGAIWRRRIRSCVNRR